MANNRVKTDPAILSARRRQKSQLRDEMERSDKHAGEVARQSLWRATHDKGVDKNQAIVFATTRLCTAVMNSMDVRASINIQTKFGDTRAWTDFQSIYINIKRDAYNLDDPRSVNRLVHFTKGLLYHEIGHIKYTTTVPDLLAAAEQQEHVVLNKYGCSANEFRRSWNYLEDQRMECAMVRYSNILRVYYTTIVLDFVTSSASLGTAWPLVAGRSYLPKPVLKLFHTSAQDSVSILDPTLVSDTSALVSRYKRATSATDMLQCVGEYVAILNRWKALNVQTPDPKGHENHPRRNDDGQQTEKRFDESADPSSSEQDDGTESEDKNPVTDDKGQGTGDGNDQGDAEGDSTDDGIASDAGDSSDGANGTDGDGASNSGDDDGWGDDNDDPITGGHNKTESSEGPAGGRGASHSDTNPSNAEDSTPPAEDTIREALEESLSSSPISHDEMTNFLSDVNGELGNTFAHNVETTEFTDEDLAKVEEVFNGMMGTLEPLAVQADPAWRFRQEQGILDPTAFSLREPGDSDYWCDLDDVGGTGFDLAVSVTLDVSGSMLAMSRDVGIAALGIRKACDALGIPCTVSTFADEGEILWNADEEPTNVYPYAKGGTNPIRILEALDDQRLGKSRHLVIALTDGSWSGVSNLAPYGAPHRVFFVVGIGNWWMNEVIGRLNANAHTVITSPAEFPEHATRALSGFFV